MTDQVGPTRLRNRCRLTGRSRGYLRKFELARNEFRRLALQGDIPDCCPAGAPRAGWDDAAASNPGPP
ncbi:MAG: hypothetical protein SFX73_34935 [Kofleriaceae bacterium]|nr:hypothetical protein [Kofleriaceae bacterium]